MRLPNPILQISACLQTTFRPNFASHFDREIMKPEAMKIVQPMNLGPRFCAALFRRFMIPRKRGYRFLLNRSGNVKLSRRFAAPRPKVCALAARATLLSALCVGQAGLSLHSLAQQPIPQASQQSQAIPDAPQAQVVAQPITAPPGPCLLKRSSVGAAWNAAKSSADTALIADPGTSGVAVATGAAAIDTPTPAPQPAPPTDAQLVPCSGSGLFLTDLSALKNLPIVKQYARFLDGPQAKRMTPKQKAWLAVRDVADPFNAITILGSSAIAVASNSHSAYGPGFPGWGRYVGVSYSQDMTAEFFGTFLIPSVMRQDPHYHRMPAASLKRRIAHVIYQVAWTQGDDGNGMVNYADLAGFGIDDEVANLYVPGRETRASATAQRYASALALAPVDNAITEFLPDIAKKIHIRVVLIQQIINQIANKDAANPAS
jgi:hypothetical protein